MEKLSLEASRKGVSVIIVYHNTVDITPENAPVRADDAQLLDIFRRCCEDNNLSFIDATDAFLAHYRETYQMPYGFSNTKPGVGHLNETGHRIIAELVYHQITELVRGQ